MVVGAPRPLAVLQPGIEGATGAAVASKCVRGRTAPVPALIAVPVTKVVGREYGSVDVEHGSKCSGVR